ncbi:MAG: apolipoprotein N-acyltransferase [Fibrobacter sp.]|jgi:apolipoprotein N-acyltransferase|nr:apolipoprotein N-acyltransferase [Fibrobacter sp.]
MPKIIEALKPIPKLYWIYAVAVLIAEAAIFTTRPDEPGLYTQNLQFVPVAIAAVFFILRPIRKNFRLSFYTYTVISFLFLALDYLSASHAGLIQISVTFLPAFLFWMLLFIRWNYRKIKEKESRQALALSLIAWGFYALAFPPLPLGPAALILLVPWFMVLNRCKCGTIMFATFWSGMLFNTINYYWIYNVMHVETAPSGLILFGLVLLIAFFSVHNVFAAFVYTLARSIKIKGKPWLLVLFPLFYAGIEMTRTRGDFSFPWSHLGYAFGNQLELLQALSIIGIFGYTTIIIASNMIVEKGIRREGLKKKWPVLIPVFILAGLAIQGSIVLSRADAQPFYIKDGDKAPNIALIQPSIAQGAKWSRARFDSIVDKTLGMAYDSVPDSVDIILMAETAIPDHLRRQPLVIRRLQKLANDKDAYVLTGALDHMRIKDSDGPRRYEIYNSSFMFSPGGGNGWQRYIKKHLVPFSERIPFDDIFPILNYVDFGEGDFVPGTETPVYDLYHWTPYICYDAIFGDLVREAAREGSRLMVNITNDGWFGRSTAPGNHLNLVRYRAIETGMPVARIANSGISAFIDQYGHYSHNTNLFETTVVQRKMQLKTRHTLYERIGDTVETALLWFFLIYLVTCSAGCILQRKKLQKQ